MKVTTCPVCKQAINLKNGLWLAMHDNPKGITCWASGVSIPSLQPNHLNQSCSVSVFSGHAR